MKENIVFENGLPRDVTLWVNNAPEVPGWVYDEIWAVHRDISWVEYRSEEQKLLVVLNTDNIKSQSDLQTILTTLTGRINYVHHRYGGPRREVPNDRLVAVLQDALGAMECDCGKVHPRGGTLCVGACDQGKVRRLIFDILQNETLIVGPDYDLLTFAMSFLKANMDNEVAATYLSIDEASDQDVARLDRRIAKELEKWGQ